MGETIRLEGAGNVRGLALWPQEDSVVLVHQRPKINIPTTQVAQGWVFTNAISILSRLHAGQDKFSIEAAVLDEPNQGYADPSDVVITQDGQRAFIACAGADTVLTVDLKRLMNYLEGKKASKRTYVAGDDLTAGRHYVIARLATQSNPRHLALSGDGKTLVVTNYLSDSLTVIDAAQFRVLAHVSLGHSAPDAVRRGEILFNSGKMTFQGQFTCASCHPNGEADGLNWDLTRDGIGNFKNTKSLLGVKDTAPYAWHGSSPNLADRIEGTLRTLHRHEPSKGDLSDLVAYLAQLPIPRPLPVTKAQQPAIDRGRILFTGKAGCSRCHRRDALDDGKSHDVGTYVPGDTQDRFDTPALRGLVRTAPYLHDGRAATLYEVFTKYNIRHRHGAADTLSKQELDDLIDYLKSL
jgi:YVTN family beta-propeller protein